MNPPTNKHKKTEIRHEPSYKHTKKQKEDMNPPTNKHKKTEIRHEPSYKQTQKNRNKT
jgi:hypothetical protein